LGVPFGPFELLGEIGFWPIFLIHFCAFYRAFFPTNFWWPFSTIPLEGVIVWVSPFPYSFIRVLIKRYLQEILFWGGFSNGSPKEKPLIFGGQLIEGFAD